MENSKWYNYYFLQFFPIKLWLTGLRRLSTVRATEVGWVCMQSWTFSAMLSFDPWSQHFLQNRGFLLSPGPWRNRFRYTSFGTIGSLLACTALSKWSRSESYSTKSYGKNGVKALKVHSCLLNGNCWRWGTHFNVFDLCLCFWFYPRCFSYYIGAFFIKSSALVSVKACSRLSSYFCKILSLEVSKLFTFPSFVPSSASCVPTAFSDWSRKRSCFYSGAVLLVISLVVTRKFDWWSFKK